MTGSQWLRGLQRTAGGLAIFHVLICAFPSVAGADLALDFDPYDPGRWEAPRYFGSGGIEPSISYEGTPDMREAIITDGAAALRLTSIMGNLERKAIATKRRFGFSEGTIQIRFKTLSRTDAAIPAENKENIDGLLDFWLVNPDTKDYLNFRLFGGEFGDNRIAMIQSSLGSGVQQGHAAWGYENWYELRIESAGGETTVTYLADDGTEILGHAFDFDLCKLGGFQVVLGQMMGRPNVESYSDIAVDFLEINERAECPVEEDEPTLCTVGPARNAVTVPIHPTTPACRCFQDRVARSDTHCMFVHPFFTGIWRFAPDVPPHEPLRIQWLFMPHVGPAASARVAIEPPPGFKHLEKGETAAGNTSRAIDHFWILSGGESGVHSAEMRLTLPNQKDPVTARFPINVRQPASD